MEIRNAKGLTESEFLEQYDAGRYPRPSVTVDMLLCTKENDKISVLLVQRGDHPFIHQYAIPGGFVNIDESLEEAAYRELKEETDVEGIELKQLYTWGAVGRDPRTRVISVLYAGMVNKIDLKPKAGDDAAEVEWFQVEKEVRSEESGCRISLLTLTGEHGRHKIQYEIEERLPCQNIYRESKVKYTPVGKDTKKLAADHAELINFAFEYYILK